MVKVLNNVTHKLQTSETDIYVATVKSMTILIQVVNPTSQDVDKCNIWVTDSSNTHAACLLPSTTIVAYNGTSDTSTHIIPAGYKIRGSADVADIAVVEITIVEGV